MAIIFQALTLVCFWIGVRGECDVDVNDSSWASFTFPDPPVNDTSPREQCEEIVGNKASIFILKIIGEDPLKYSRFTIHWNGKWEKIETKSQGITKFIDSSLLNICCKWNDRCTSNSSVFYKEIERGNIQNIIKNAEGFIQPEPLPDCRKGSRYRPNAISFWGIKVRNGSVKLTVDKLNLDDYAGDYLLIGSSITNYGNTNDVFQGPPPLFLTGSSNKPKNIIVSTSYQSQVYVMLVSKTPKRSDASGFHIRYKANSERIGVVSTEAPIPTIAESWKEAISICAKVPKNDNDETVNFTITSFVVRQALQELNRDPFAKSINSSQIRVIILGQQRPLQEEYFAMLTIESWNLPNLPLLKAEQLRKMFYTTAYPPGYKILLCDEIPVDGEWLKPVTLAFVPIFCFFLIVLWWLRYKCFWSSRVKKYEEKPTLQVEMSPPLMINPAFEPDSPLPHNETEHPSPYFTKSTQKKQFNFNEDSGFASCSTHQSSAKSTPAMAKRKVLFNIPSEEAKGENTSFKDTVDNQKGEQKENDGIRL